MPAILILAALVFVLIVAFGIWLNRPPAIHELTSHSHPTSSYSEAIDRIATLTAGEDTDFAEACRTHLLTHGERTKHVIIFAHGYTNCPKQFAELGRAFFELGYNVLIPPLPYHGLADRMTEKQALLTAEALARYADEVVDIAQGLGEKVVMAGLSGGGVTTAWAAQHRQDIDLAVVISPAFGFQAIPTAFTTPAAKLFRIVPNFYRWWDPVLQESVGPSHAYPRMASRALAGILRLGSATLAAASYKTPAARSVLVIMNASDRSINNELVRRYVEYLRKQNYNGLRTYEFEADLKLGHDLIEPAQPEQRIDLIYPKLIELMTISI